MQLRYAMRWALLSLVMVMSLLPGGAVEAAPNPVVVNEVDCHGNDWIELYNTSATVFDLSGWGLSDKNPNSATARHLYVFQNNTMIAGKGYLIVEQKGVGSQALTFGIACAGGESIRLLKPLTAAAFETVSQIDIPKIFPQFAYGRLPNGTGAFQSTKPTKRSSNVSSQPRFVGTKNLRCGAGKSCVFRLSATNSGKFALLPGTKGVAITAGGTLRFGKHQRGTHVIQLKMTNAAGSQKVSLSIRVT